MKSFSYKTSLSQDNFLQQLQKEVTLQDEFRLISYLSDGGAVVRGIFPPENCQTSFFGVIQDNSFRIVEHTHKEFISPYQPILVGHFEKNVLHLSAQMHPQAYPLISLYTSLVFYCVIGIVKCPRGHFIFVMTTFLVSARVFPDFNQNGFYGGPSTGYRRFWKMPLELQRIEDKWHLYQNQRHPCSDGLATSIFTRLGDRWSTLYQSLRECGFEITWVWMTQMSVGIVMMSVWFERLGIIRSLAIVTWIQTVATEQTDRPRKLFLECERTYLFNWKARDSIVPSVFLDLNDDILDKLHIFCRWSQINLSLVPPHQIVFVWRQQDSLCCTTLMTYLNTWFFNPIFPPLKHKVKFLWSFGSTFSHSTKSVPGDYRVQDHYGVRTKHLLTLQIVVHIEKIVQHLSQDQCIFGLIFKYGRWIRIWLGCQWSGMYWTCLVFSAQRRSRSLFYYIRDWIVLVDTTRRIKVSSAGIPWWILPPCCTRFKFDDSRSIFEPKGYFDLNCSTINSLWCRVFIGDGHRTRCWEFSTQFCILMVQSIFHFFIVEYLFHCVDNQNFPRVLQRVLEGAPNSQFEMTFLTPVTTSSKDRLQ